MPSYFNDGLIGYNMLSSILFLLNSLKSFLNVFFFKLFNKYLLSVFFVPDSVLRIGIQQFKKINPTLKVPALTELDSNWGKQPMSKYKGKFQISVTKERNMIAEWN